MNKEEDKKENDEQLYEVEKILDRKKIKGKYKYLIKWKGYSMDECTWEPLSSLENIKDYVEQFDAAIENDKYIHLEEEIKEEDEIKDENKENENIDNIINTSSKDKTKKNKKLIKKKRKLSEEVNKENDKENNSIIEEKEKEKNKVNNKKIIEIDESFTNIIGIKMKNNELIAVVERKVKNKNKEEIISTKKLREINPLILIDYYEKRIYFE